MNVFVRADRLLQLPNFPRVRYRTRETVVLDCLINGRRKETDGKLLCSGIEPLDRLIVCDISDNMRFRDTADF